jgi:sterol desaturase/sphingolipid hydroxylase (fatty acid hydroxylase superfamily)
MSTTITPPTTAHWIRKLADSKFNYWAGYVANLTLISWYVSHAFSGGALLLSPLRFVLVVVAAWFTWTLTEYVSHRWLYHVWNSPLTKGHGLHHEHPEGLLGLPWYIPMPVLIGLYYLFASFLDAASVGLFLGVWWLGFVGYCFIHHSIHHFSFQNRWFKALWRHHKVHHKMEGRNFGVTAIFWDRVFGTYHSK